MRILIADDNELVRRAIRTLLSREATWQVCGEAADGLQAFQKAQELKPDLVLLDISMPVAGGFETARRMRSEIPEIRILIMSQEDAAHILPSALQCGADACIDKARLASDLIPSVKRFQPNASGFTAS